MLCYMKYLVCLLLSLAAGFGTYALGAVVWCTIDPDGAGAKLLFTIPIALTGMAIPAILGMLAFVFRTDFIRDPKPARAPAAATADSLAPPRSVRTSRARLATAPAMDVDDQDALELALAT
jgi:hypothetical protein